MHSDDTPTSALHDSGFALAHELSRASMADPRRFTLDSMLSRSQVLSRKWKARNDSVNQNVQRKIIEVTHSHAIASFLTGMNAHYRFSELTSGTYWLFAEWTFNGRPHDFLEVQSVDVGEKAVLDLKYDSWPASVFDCGRLKAQTLVAP